MIIADLLTLLIKKLNMNILIDYHIDSHV